MEFDFNFYVFKGWFHHGHFYAYGLGTNGFSCCSFVANGSSLVFIAIMGYESEYTQNSRDLFFDDGKPDKVWAVPHGAHKSDHNDGSHSTGEAH